MGDFSKGMTLLSQKDSVIGVNYSLNRIKKSQIHYRANEPVLAFKSRKEEKISIVLKISNNDVAFKYILAQNGERSNCTIERELTGFKFPTFTTTFLTHKQHQ